MKKVLGLVLATVVAVGVSASFAGEGCCASKAKAQAAGASCTDALSKLNLTAEQKAKLATLQEQAKRAPSTSEGNAILAAGMEKILTPEQLAECKTNCSKEKAGGGCPFMSKTDKKS
ncbi:MAG: hypothetical protein PCFJNLEI_03108 [Verrucomicrobiae bacterium]|nr:hypothetical protein [Verrucomicrobiae bacterium]